MESQKVIVFIVIEVISVIEAQFHKKKNAEFEVSLLFMKIEFKDYITYYFFYLLKSYRVNSFFIIIQLVIILFSSQSYRIFFYWLSRLIYGHDTNSSRS